MPTLRRFLYVTSPVEIHVPAGSRLVGAAGGHTILHCPDGPDLLHLLQALSFPRDCDVIQLQPEYSTEVQFLAHEGLVMALQAAAHPSAISDWAAAQERAWEAYRATPTPANYKAWAALVPRWQEVPNGNDLPFTWVPGNPFGGEALNNCAAAFSGVSEGCQICGGFCPGLRRGAP